MDYDNGFSRAQAAYDRQEPPNDSDGHESYVDKYVTKANEASLAIVIIKDPDKETKIKKLLRNLEPEDLAAWMAQYGLIPSWEQFQLDSIEDYDPRENQEPELDRDEDDGE